ncbi:MAG: Ig domain-containing protein, partial [Cutibacterium sp.]|nr:Ig domain-containing protein [Cutibacterium sp.]
FNYGGDAKYSNGSLTSSSNQSVVDNYLVNTEAMVGDNYRIYCLGSNSDSPSYANQISSLSDYLASVHEQDPDNEQVIFIITHFPLHYYSSYRTTASASDVIDVLNSAVEDYGQKIVFLWGHNHTEAPGETHYDEIFTPEYELQYASSSSNKKTIQFYYAAAGCMSDTEYSSWGGSSTGSPAVKGKGLVITINSKDQLSFAYIDKNYDIVEGGTFTEQDPIPVESVAIDEAGANPSVEVGKRVSLHYTVSPEDATVKSVTWTSETPSIATVDSNGKVKGVAVGTAVITVTVSDGLTRNVASASIEVDVTESTSTEEYFVIMIDDYALSSNIYDGYMSNSSGYEYHGLEAVSYSTSDPAPYDILWTLEPVDDVENGYYIKSYSGDYLSATYVRGSQSSTSGYTGTLTVGDTQDVWVVTSGIDAWQGNGSYLKSTNASDNPRPADIYLTTRTSNSSEDFFTVGSSSNYKTSKLIQPDEIDEPVSVTGITLDTTQLEIEAGKSWPIVANVIPENASDKTVEWTSSDDSVATVGNDGRVRGVSPGTATITATTNDGGYKAYCEVTVTPSAAPGIGYVITIGDYAMSSQPSSDMLVNAGSGTQQYTYTGLTGVQYDGTGEPTADMLWLIEPAPGGGYYIKSQDGLYLNATYGPNSTGGNSGVLKVDETPDVWTFDGSLEDWVLNGSTLHSANSDKYLTHEEGSSSAPLNLFTVRSTGEESSMIDPDNQAEVRYVEVDSLRTGADYIIAATASGTSVYAVKNMNGSSSGNTGSATLGADAYFPAAGGEAAYIVTGDTTIVWNYTSSRYLSNNGRYLSRPYSGTAVPYASGTGRQANYDSQNKRLSISYNGTYYLTNSSGTFGYTQTAGSASQIRIFEKMTVFNFKYVVQFVSNGENYFSGKYATGEVPVYSGVTPTRAENQQYTYVFTGWSSDGGTTIYGPDDELPAVTGPVTYVAQFRAVPKPAFHTVTFVDENGDELQSSEVEAGQMPEYAGETPTKVADADFGYTFAGWDPELAEVTEDVTYTATYTSVPRQYGEPVWTWNGNDENGYTSAIATFTTIDEFVPVATKAKTDGELTITTVYPTCTVAGSTTYVASVTFDGEEYTDSKVVAISATGHTVVTDEAVAATCTETGLTEGSHCSVCGEVLVAQEVVPALGHDWDEGVVTTPPTCTETGVKTFTCSRCGETRTESIDALGHEAADPVIENNVEPTCTAEGGYDTVVYCSICGEELSREHTVVEALGHDYVAVVTEPTCTEAGYTTHTCSRCGDSYVDSETEALGHDWGDWTVTTEPTCTEAGEQTRHCSRCDATETQDVEALGHDWGDWTLVTPATCTQAGSEQRTCSRCDEVETREVAALGHTEGEPVIENNVEPTCTAEGGYDTVVYCSICGEELSREH